MTQSNARVALRDRTQLLVLAGSRAHGTAGPDADVDLIGIATPTAAQVLGLRRTFTHADAQSDLAPFHADLTDDEQRAVANTKLEGTVYSVSRFLELVTKANPTLLEVLSTRDEEVRRLTPLGQQLRDHRHLFLTERCRQSFVGYATSQLSRIRLHHRWNADGPRDGDDRYAYDTWRAHRSPERAALEARFGYDTKHGAHLVRLLRLGIEALTTGTLHVWRGDRDAEELRHIRAGGWSYERLCAWTDATTATLEQTPSVLPAEPDRTAIEALCVTLNGRGLGLGGQ